MKLYQLPYSHYSAKVTIALLEKGLAFEAPELGTGYQKSPDCVALNPLGKVPFFQDASFVLSYWYIGLLSKAHGKPVPDAASVLKAAEISLAS